MRSEDPEDAAKAFRFLSSAMPRILVVSRRSVRKNKFVDFVGEYHLDLIVKYGGCPIIVPRVENVSHFLDAFEPVHGVLLAEGEDISTAFRPAENAEMDGDLLQTIREAHPSDTEFDLEKDSIEFQLVEKCIANGIPLLGICRGSQIVNVVSGGSLLLDIEAMTQSTIKHIDYSNYDDHRHSISIASGSPLMSWFDGAREIDVNSYHHQGVRTLGPNLHAMAHSPDGLVEAFYDPSNYMPSEGRFLIGLQFHPERMQNTNLALKGEKNTYDYPGCPRVYEDFVLAATAYRALQSSNHMPSDPLSGVNEVEWISPASARKTFATDPKLRISALPDGIKSEHEDLVQAFSLASKVYHSKEKLGDENSQKVLLSKGASFLEVVAPLSTYSKEDLDRIIRSGATVHGSGLMRQMLEDRDSIEASHRTKKKGSHLFESNGLRNEWHRFQKGIIAAELALENLRGTEREEEAVAHVNKLSEFAAAMAKSSEKSVQSHRNVS